MPTDAGTLNEWADKIASTKLVYVLIVHLLLDVLIGYKVLMASKKGTWKWGSDFTKLEEQCAEEKAELINEKNEWKRVALPALNALEANVHPSHPRKRRR